MEFIIRIALLCLAFVTAIVSPVSLIGSSPLNWTGNLTLDALLLLLASLFFVVALGGRFGGKICLAAQMMALCTALLTFSQLQNLDTTTTVIVIASMITVSFRQKIWLWRGADFSVEASQKKAKTPPATNALALVGVAALAKETLKKSGNRNPPTVKYLGDGQYLGIEHLGGNTWEVSFTDKYSTKIKKAKMNRGNDKIMPYTNHKFEFKW